MITLATLEQATAQEVFDQVARHLLTQKERGTGPGRGCKYRGTNGLKCAGGILIADNEYEAQFEGRTWRRLVVYDLVPRAHAELICNLQDIHDKKATSEWRNELHKCAARHHLQWNPQKLLSTDSQTNS